MVRKQEELEKILKISFKNKDLLRQSLTHTSYVHEQLQHVHDKYAHFYSNERLEFLGDSVLNMVVCHYLFFTLPHLEEGELAKLKSYIISQETLQRWAGNIDLGDYILLGKGEEVSGGRKKPSILADTFEAVIGALFLDTNNIKNVSEFIMVFLEEDSVIGRMRPAGLDFKTTLQEKTQALYRRLPVYKNYKEYGPDHGKIYEVDVCMDDTVLGHGKGHSKKEAEMVAAKEALEKMK